MESAPPLTARPVPFLAFFRGIWDLFFKGPYLVVAEVDGHYYRICVTRSMFAGNGLRIGERLLLLWIGIAGGMMRSFISMNYYLIIRR